MNLIDVDSAAPPAPHRPRWQIALVIVGLLSAVTVGLAFAWWPSADTDAPPTPRPTASPPGLAGGGTFSIDFRTELWISGVEITAHSGDDDPDRTRASYSVSGPGFETITVRDAPNTVIDVPGWGQLTAEGVRSERVKRTVKPGETGAIPPTGTLYFRAVTDFPLVPGSHDFPADT